MKFSYRIEWKSDGKLWKASGAFTAPPGMSMSEKASQVLAFEGVKAEDVIELHVNQRKPRWRFWGRR